MGLPFKHYRRWRSHIVNMNIFQVKVSAYANPIKHRIQELNADYVVNELSNVSLSLL
jgi:hypothetical protein